MKNNKPHLLYGGILSFAILIILFMIRRDQPDLLNIDARWLIVAGIPLLVALILDGHISEIKGPWGSIKLEAQKKLIDNPSIVHVLRPMSATSKEGLSVLFNMPEKKLETFRVLTFEAGKRDYYDSYAISEYVRRMPNVNFFEIKLNGHFHALMEIRRADFSYGDSFEIGNLIKKIEQEKFDDLNYEFSTKSVDLTYSVIETFEAIEKSGKSFIAVLDNSDNGKLKGVVFEREVDKFLAKLVVNSPHIKK